MRITLNDDGAKALIFLKSQGADPAQYVAACVVTLTGAVLENPCPGAAETHVVEVDDSYVQVCLDRGFEPGALLSQFMVDVLDATEEPAAGVQGTLEGL